MTTKPEMQFFDRFWDSCICPPAVWGQANSYPFCFSVLFIFIAAFIWYEIGESEHVEGLLLFFLPTKYAQIIKQRIASCRSILAQHRGPPRRGPQREAAAAANAADLHPPCPVCGAGGGAAASPTAAAAAASECAAVTEAKTFLSAARNRCIGGYHAAATTVLALCCVVLDERLRQDRANGTSPLFTLTGIVAGGYFLWDLYIIIAGWGPGSLQWLLHAIVSFWSVCTPFLFRSTPMCFYAASLLLFEASTPFFAIRYFLLKAGAGEKRAGKLVHALFVASFFLVRIVYGCLYLFPTLAVSFLSHPEISNIHFARKMLYLVSLPLFGILQFLWFVEMIILSFKKRGQTKAD